MEQLSLFDQAGDLGAPLASRLRPQSLDEFVGQKHLLGEGRMLRQLIERDQISSMIFWGLRVWARRHWQGSLPGERERSLSISAPSPAESGRSAR